MLTKLRQTLNTLTVYLGLTKPNSSYTPRFLVLSPEQTEVFRAEVLRYVTKHDAPPEVVDAVNEFFEIRFKPAMIAMYEFNRAAPTGSGAAYEALNKARAHAVARLNAMGIPWQGRYDEVTPEDIEATVITERKPSPKTPLTLAKAVCGLPQAFMLLKLLAINPSPVFFWVLTAGLAFLFSVIWHITLKLPSVYLASTQHLSEAEQQSLRANRWKGVFWGVVNLLLLAALLTLDAHFFFQANLYDQFGNPSPHAVSMAHAAIAAFIFSGALFAATLAWHVVDEQERRERAYKIAQLREALERLRKAEAAADAAEEQASELFTQFYSTWLTLLAALRAVKSRLPAQKIVDILLIIPTGRDCRDGDCR